MLVIWNNKPRIMDTWIAANVVTMTSVDLWAMPFLKAIYFLVLCLTEKTFYRV